MNIEIGNKPIDFVFQGDELIYPNYVAKDNLVLHYDFSGRTNLDVKKGIAEDLSGSGNDGILENFAYESGSGYDSNSYLEFDNVDDFITIPELNLDVNNFTVAVDGEVLSYRGDNVAKINENGLEIGGRNLIKGTQNFDSSYWGNGVLKVVDDVTYRKTEDDWRFSTNEYIEGGRDYTYSIEVLNDTSETATVDIHIMYVENGNKIIKFWVITQAPNSKKRHSTTFKMPASKTHFRTYLKKNPSEPNSVWLSLLKLEKGNKATDWSPAPEDLQTTKITPIFSNKIKTLMYWNRALTDVELQEVYNVQKHRI